MNGNAAGLLEIPSVQHRTSIRKYLDACALFGEALPWDPTADASDTDLDRYIENLARGVWTYNDEETRSNTFHYWFVVNQEILGRCTLRTHIEGSFGESHGHIGYDVHPHHRNRGVGTEMLKSLLTEARLQGMSRVLITCDISNEASRRMIEKCGGVMRDTFENKYLRFDVML